MPNPYFFGGFRFLETAFLSNAGHILAKSDAFAVETHEACDWMRLFKNKKVRDIAHVREYTFMSVEQPTIRSPRKRIIRSSSARTTVGGMLSCLHAL